MKSKKIICLLLVILIVFCTLNINSYAVTLPELSITSNNYSAGDKMRYDDVKDVEVEKSLQLYAVIAHGNEMLIDDNYDSLGLFVDEANLSGVTWTSSNTGIATVDNNGKVTGVAEGKTTITATYNGESANYEINVKPKSGSDFTGLVLVDKNLTPQPVLVLNKEHGFGIYLYNIPDTEKGNIKVTIDNENVAKITGIDLCNWEDGSGKGMIIANAKFLSLGQFTITATLNYNGKTYSDSYTNGVAESRYTLTLSAKEYTDLPSTLEVGDKIQLTATLGHVGAALFKDVTTNGVTWTSSNDKIATVDKGLVTAKREGKVTITAKYNGTDDSVTETYEITIKDSTKSPVTPGTSSESSSTDSPTTKNDSTISPTILPKTGENSTIMIIGIILIVAISMIMYKKYKNYKDIK